jgi:hypothetical protein
MVEKRWLPQLPKGTAIAVVSVALQNKLRQVMCANRKVQK